MCGHRLVATSDSAGTVEGDLAMPRSRTGRDDDEEVTLSYAGDAPTPVSSAAATACEICGEATDGGNTHCDKCAGLLASSEDRER